MFNRKIELGGVGAKKKNKKKWKSARNLKTKIELDCLYRRLIVALLSTFHSLL